MHAVDLDDSVRAGLTALPNAAADAAGGLPISDAGGLDLDAMNTNVNDVETDTTDIQARLPAALVGGRIDATIDAADFEDAAVDKVWDELTAEARTAGSYGQKLKDLVLSAGRVDVGQWLGAAVNALIGGRIDGERPGPR